MIGAAEHAEVRARLAAIPEFPGRPEQARIERLGGLTNRSYRIDAAGQRFVLRLPLRRGGHLDRRAEAHNLRIASQLGLTPEILFFDESDGTMLTRFVAGGQPLTAGTLRDPALLRQAVLTLRRLHDSGAVFRGEQEPFATFDVYVARARQAGAPPSPALLEARQAAEPLRAALQAHRQPPRPCHVDPAPQNFLRVPADGPPRLFLIDWEYSAMAEPVWDLADLSTEAGFDETQDRAMLAVYAGETTPGRIGHLQAYKAALDLLAAAWAHLQIAEGNPAGDFAALVRERLDRCRAVLERPDFVEHLARLPA